VAVSQLSPSSASCRAASTRLVNVSSITRIFLPSHAANGFGRSVSANVWTLALRGGARSQRDNVGDFVGDANKMVRPRTMGAIMERARCLRHRNDDRGLVLGQ
jgi:hypothetical protein